MENELRKNQTDSDASKDSDSFYKKHPILNPFEKNLDNFEKNPSNSRNILRKLEENLSSSTGFEKIFFDSSTNSQNFCAEEELPETNLTSPKLNLAEVQKLKISEKNSNFATFCNPDTRPYVSISISQKRVDALLDSGSTRSYVGKKIAEKLGKFKETQAVMTAANKEITPILGEKDVLLTFEVRNVNFRSKMSVHCLAIFFYDLIF